MKKFFSRFRRGWVIYSLVISLFIASNSVAFAATSDPFSSLGNGTLPSFLTNPIDDLRYLIGVALLLAAGWRMFSAYFKGHHRLVYAAIFPLLLIEWVLFSPDTLFTIASTVFGWIFSHWFGGGASGG